MFKFSTSSGWEPFCHCSSCLRESRKEGTAPLADQTFYSGNKLRIPKVLTFNKFFDSLSVNRIIVLGRYFPISLTLPLLVPAVLHNQRDDELFGLWLFWTAAEFSRRISITPKDKLKTLCADNPDAPTTTSSIILTTTLHRIVNFSIKQTPTPLRRLALALACDSPLK